MDLTLTSVISKAVLALGALVATLAIVGTVNAAKPQPVQDKQYMMDQCKNGGWKNFPSPPGPFKNQGQCVSYFASGGKNVH